VTQRASSLLAAALLLVALLAVAQVLPVPYVALLPGPAVDTFGVSDGHTGRPLIEVAGRRTYPARGELLLTTVDEQPHLTLMSAVRRWLSGTAAVVPRELEQPNGVSEQNLQATYDQQMRDSQNAAESAAIGYLQIPASVIISEASVGAAAGPLRSGVQLVALNGAAVRNLAGFLRLQEAIHPGAVVQVGYRRDRAAPSTAVITANAPTRGAGPLGLSVREKAPFTLNFGLSGVGGPSAGLMFALAIIAKLTPGGINGGRILAGSGTIDPAGTIGPVGGIQQKLLGAQRAGAVVFRVPAQNCVEARRAVPPGLQLIKVDSLSDAVDDVRAVGARQTNEPRC